MLQIIKVSLKAINLSLKWVLLNLFCWEIMSARQNLSQVFGEMFYLFVINCFV